MVHPGRTSSKSNHKGIYRNWGCGGWYLASTLQSCSSLQGHCVLVRKQSPHKNTLVCLHCRASVQSNFHVAWLMRHAWLLVYAGQPNLRLGICSWIWTQHFHTASRWIERSYRRSAWKGFKIDSVVTGNLFPLDYRLSSLNHNCLTSNLINRSWLQSQVLPCLLVRSVPRERRLKEDKHVFILIQQIWGNSGWPVLRRKN